MHISDQVLCTDTCLLQFQKDKHVATVCIAAWAAAAIPGVQEMVFSRHIQAWHTACSICWRHAVLPNSILPIASVWHGAGTFINSLSVYSGEEERRQAHEALEAQEAELARYAEQVAADQQQAAALQAKIKAMEEKARAPSMNPSCCVFSVQVCVLIMMWTTTATFKALQRNKACLFLHCLVLLCCG